MRVGYGRVSTLDQNLDAQYDALKIAGCEVIFVDKRSGAKADRPELLAALKTVREGDQLVVTKLDRLSRSVIDLLTISKELQVRRVDLVSLGDNIDTSTPIGEFFFTVTAAIAQLVRQQIVLNTREGLAAARRRGKVGGRRRAMTDAQVQAAIEFYEKSDATWQQVADEFRVPVRTLHTARRRLNQKESGAAPSS